MYGYFDLKDVCLSAGERHVFSCYYCRLCYCLWNKGGHAARYLTTYDATVYNLIIANAGFDSKPKSFNCQRILTGNKKHFKDDEVGGLIADLGILAFALKVRDNADDGDKGKAFIANLLFGRLFKKEIKKYPEVYEQGYQSIKELDAAQKANAPVDEALEIYGSTMAKTFKSFFPLEEKHLMAIDHLARWTFLVDMLDDYDKDFASGALNSFKREDSPTRQDLFDKHYDEILPIINKECLALRKAIDEIRSPRVEWYIVEKIVAHALENVIPGILEGKDVRYHYVRDTIANWKRARKNREVTRNYEKGPVNS